MIFCCVASSVINQNVAFSLKTQLRISKVKVFTNMCIFLHCEVIQVYFMSKRLINITKTVNCY